MAPHSSVLAWRIPGTEEPSGPLSLGSHRAGHNWSDLACIHGLEKEMAPHSSILAWRIPGLEEPGGLLSMGSHRVGHNWSDLAAVQKQPQREHKQMSMTVSHEDFTDTEIWSYNVHESWNTILLLILKSNIKTFKNTLFLAHSCKPELVCRPQFDSGSQVLSD